MTEEWMAVHSFVDPEDGGAYESALCGALETTHGTLSISSNERDSASEDSILFKVEVSSDLVSNLATYFFVKTALTEDYPTYLTSLFMYQIKKKGVIHPDDFERARWFTIDEVFSFKNVSFQLKQILLENQNMFHNDLH
jgi:hypothetical protein